VVFATPQYIILLTIRHLSKTPHFHPSNHLTNDPNSTFQTPLLHPEKRSIIPLPTATIWHLVLSHYTFTPGLPPSTGSQQLHSYSRSSSFTWCSAITPLPPVILLHLVLSHYTLTAGHPPSTGSQPLHPYRRSSSFNWCSEPVKEFIATKAFSYVPKYLMKQS